MGIIFTMKQRHFIRALGIYVTSLKRRVTFQYNCELVFPKLMTRWFELVLKTKVKPVRAIANMRQTEVLACKQINKQLHFHTTRSSLGFSENAKQAVPRMLDENTWENNRHKIWACLTLAKKLSSRPSSDAGVN